MLPGSAVRHIHACTRRAAAREHMTSSHPREGARTTKRLCPLDSRGSATSRIRSSWAMVTDSTRRSATSLARAANVQCHRHATSSTRRTKHTCTTATYLWWHRFASARIARRLQSPLAAGSPPRSPLSCACPDPLPPPSRSFTSALLLLASWRGGGDDNAEWGDEPSRCDGSTLASTDSGGTKPHDMRYRLRCGARGLVMASTVRSRHASPTLASSYCPSVSVGTS